MVQRAWAISTSMRRLRRFLRAASGATAPRCAPAHSARFLHTLPLLRSNHHNKFGHKYIVLERAARQKVIAYLNVSHSDGVASLTQGGVFIQLDGLRDIVGAH